MSFLKTKGFIRHSKDECGTWNIGIGGLRLSHDKQKASLKIRLNGLPTIIFVSLIDIIFVGLLGYLIWTVFGGPSGILLSIMLATTILFIVEIGPSFLSLVRGTTAMRGVLGAQQGPRVGRLVRTGSYLVSKEVRERQLDEWLDDLQCRRERGERAWPAAIWIVLRSFIPSHSAKLARLLHDALKVNGIVSQASVMRKAVIRTALVGGGVAVIDLLSKHAMNEWLLFRPKNLGVSSRLAPWFVNVHGHLLMSHIVHLFPVLNLEVAHNSGILGGSVPAPAPVIYIMVFILMVHQLIRNLRTSYYVPWLWLFSGLFLGGMIGNVAEQLFSGSVTDFLQISIGHFGSITNVADIAILIGGFMAFVWPKLKLAYAISTPRPSAVVASSDI